VDLSIYKDEAQLDKISSARKRKSKKSSEDDDDSDSLDEPVLKKAATSSKKSLTPRASTRKPIVENAMSESESDEENLMEIKKKAKKQVRKS
jgi:hypothetical protein